MPAKLDIYKYRNEQIGTARVYVCRPFSARLSVDGFPVDDFTRATVVDTFDFDFPYMYQLEDGRLTRSGGLSWIRADGSGDTVSMHLQSQISDWLSERKRLYDFGKRI